MERNSTWQILRFEEIDSTNSALKRMPDAPHGTVLLTERQTGGRGRLGRQFASPPGGIYLSVLLRPQVSADELLALTPMTAVAVRRAILTCCGVDVRIKWINDLVYGTKKLCGILTELVTDAESGTITGAIIGIGINCNTSTEDFPPDVRKIATSLRRITGKTVEKEALVAAILDNLHALDAALGHDRAAWLREYEAACVTVGKTVQIIRGNRHQVAFATGIDAFGGLQVRYEDGRTDSISSGEVSVRGMYGYIESQEDIT